MIKILKYKLALLTMLSCYAYGQNDSSNFKNEEVHYFVEDNFLIIIDKIDPRQVRIPNINSIKSLDVVLVRPTLGKDDKDKDKDKKDETKKDLKIDKSEIGKYILEAKKLFNNGDIVGAWDIVDELETLAPKDYRIKTMKGSLYYTSEEYDKAILYWKESLNINKNQTKVRSMIKEAERKRRNK